jgi:hypothetical protein
MPPDRSIHLFDRYRFSVFSGKDTLEFSDGTVDRNYHELVPIQLHELDPVAALSRKILRTLAGIVTCPLDFSTAVCPLSFISPERAFTKDLREETTEPQGLKPPSLGRFNGTAKAVPFPNRFTDSSPRFDLCLTIPILRSTRRRKP